MSPINRDAHVHIFIIPKGLSQGFGQHFACQSRNIHTKIILTVKIKLSF